MPAEQAYDVFLSYHSSSQKPVEALAQRLRDAGLEVFFDRWSLVPGAPWQEALEEALAASRTITAFISPGGLGPWQTEEVRVALDLRVRQVPERVIPTLLPGSSEAEVPSFLSRLTWVDLRKGIDDPEAFKRLLAGIRGEAPGVPEPAHAAKSSRPTFEPPPPPSHFVGRDHEIRELGPVVQMDPEESERHHQPHRE